MARQITQKQANRVLKVGLGWALLGPLAGVATWWATGTDSQAAQVETVARPSKRLHWFWKLLMVLVVLHVIAKLKGH